MVKSLRFKPAPFEVFNTTRDIGLTFPSDPPHLRITPQPGELPFGVTSRFLFDFFDSVVYTVSAAKGAGYFLISDSLHCRAAGRYAHIMQTPYFTLQTPLHHRIDTAVDPPVKLRSVRICQSELYRFIPRRYRLAVKIVL
jgi:hypothetical protein